MHPVLRGLLAGAAATALLAVMLWINAELGPLRELDPAALVARVLGEDRSVGWSVLLTVGIAGFGLSLAALTDPDEPGLPWVPALTLSVGGWVAAMMGLLPMAGHAPFGIGQGPVLALLSAAWAVLFGAALAAAWAWLPRATELLQQWKAQALPGATLRS